MLWRLISNDLSFSGQAPDAVNFWMGDGRAVTSSECNLKSGLWCYFFEHHNAELPCCSVIATIVVCQNFGTCY